MALLPRYTCQPIAALSPAPQNVSFQGQITNITPIQIDRKSTRAARGCIELLIADESSEIIVKLWYYQKSYEAIRLGRIVRVSTTHISPTVTSDVTADAIHCLPAKIVTGIFPEKDMGSSIEFLQNSQQRDTSHEMSLRRTELTCLEDCFQVCTRPKLDLEVLVLVLDVGSPRTVTTRTNESFQVIEITVIDSSSLQTSPSIKVSTACVSFNPVLFSSTSTFIPRHTMLLISKPKVFCPTLRKLEITPCSQVLIDPCSPETRLLRSWANRLFAIPPYSTSSGDSLTCDCSSRFLATIDKQSRGEVPRKQFTLASFLDEIDLRRQQVAQRRSYWRRFAKDPILVGYISVVVISISLVDMFRSSQLFHATCPRCRMRVSANIPIADHLCSVRIDIPSKGTISAPSNSESIDTTKVAETHKLDLYWNSQLLRGISDETGGLLLQDKEDRHNLQLTDRAVLGLTGLSREDLEQLRGNTSDTIDGVLGTNERYVELPERRENMDLRLCWIEEQVLWARMTLTLGWTTGCTSMIRRGEYESSRTRDDESQAGCNEESIVVLNVSS